MHNIYIMKYGVGDIVELVPANCPDDWYEGTGLILSTENGVYYILFSDLRKTSRKNLSTIEFGSRYYKFNIEMSDRNEIFKILA